MARVRLVVSDEQKQRWSKAVQNDPSADSLSDLIRDAVESHIARDPDDHDEEAELDPVLDELDELDKRLYDLQNALRSLQQDTPTRTEMERLHTDTIDELRSDIPVSLLKMLEDENHDFAEYK